MDNQKVMTDWLIATQDAIYILQVWLGSLESWRDIGRAEPDDFSEACQQLRDTGLWPWAGEAGGHGLTALARAVGVNEFCPERGNDDR